MMDIVTVVTASCVLCVLWQWYENSICKKSKRCDSDLGIVEGVKENVVLFCVDLSSFFVSQDHFTVFDTSLSRCHCG